MNDKRRGTNREMLMQKMARRRQTPSDSAEYPRALRPARSRQQLLETPGQILPHLHKEPANTPTL